MEDFIKFVFGEKAFYGHAGSPGKVGGSVAATSSMSRTTGAAAVAKMRGRSDSKIAAANPDGEPLKQGGYKAGKPGSANENESEKMIRVINGRLFPSVWNSDTWIFGDDNPYKKKAQMDKAMIYDVATELSERTDLSFEDCNSALESWITSSNQTMKAMSLQEDFAEELGVELSDWQKESKETLEEAYPEYPDKDRRIAPKEGQKRLAREMYNLTQERLDYFLPGRKTVTLYRGVRDYDYTSGDIVEYKGNAIESWSLSWSSASRFGGNVFSMEVPIENIVGSYFSGFGCLDEYEVVVFGSVPGNRALVVQDESFGDIFD